VCCVCCVCVRDEGCMRPRARRRDTVTQRGNRAGAQHRQAAQSVCCRSGIWGGQQVGSCSKHRRALWGERGLRGKETDNHELGHLLEPLAQFSANNGALVVSHRHLRCRTAGWAHTRRQKSVVSRRVVSRCRPGTCQWHPSESVHYCRVWNSVCAFVSGFGSLPTLHSHTHSTHTQSTRVWGKS
jgi:hypothetical protein